MNMHAPVSASILVLDPDRDFLESVEKLKKNESVQLTTRVLDSVNRHKLTEWVQELYPDIVVVNLDLDGELDFGSAVTEINSIPTGLPPLILGTTAKEDLSLKIKAYNLGIDDLLLRPFQSSELWLRIGVLLRLRNLQRQLDSASRNLAQANANLSNSNVRLEEMTLTDELTGLSNMRYMTKFLENQFLILKRHPRPFAVLMMDIDKFKLVNDKNDHLVGSRTIQKIGHVIERVMRKMDVKARYGGDEFTIAMPETERTGAELAANRLREAIQQEPLEGSNGSVFHVTASMGVAAIDFNRHQSFEDLVRDADNALYQAKKRGRNCVVWYEHGKTEVITDEERKKTD